MLQMQEEQAERQSDLKGLLATVSAARHEQQDVQRQIGRLRHEQQLQTQVSPVCSAHLL